MTLPKILIILFTLALIGIGGWYLYHQGQVSSLGISIKEARLIASASQCSEKGTVNSGGAYNSNSKTWWFNLEVKDEFKQEGCNPACVVSGKTKTAEINWRCTGLKEDLISVSIPKPSQVVRSPLSIEGEARGNWYFEASFPIKLIDADGRELAQGIAQAKSDWMTENFVPFEGSEVTVTSILWKSAMVFAIARPIPVPSALLLSFILKRENSLPFCSVVIPLPVSDITTMKSFCSF